MLETSVKTPVNCKLYTYSPEWKFSTARSRHLALKQYHTIGSIECHFRWWIEYVINLFVQKYSGKKKMECNPSLKSGNVGCLGNLRWLMDPSTSRVTVNLLQQPGAHLNGDLEDSPMVDGERMPGGQAGGVGRGTVHLASPACLFPLGVEREMLSSLHIYWCLSSHHGKLVQIYLTEDLQGIMNASVPRPKCLSGRLDNARRSRCGENPGSTV